MRKERRKTIRKWVNVGGQYKILNSTRKGRGSQQKMSQQA